MACGFGLNHMHAHTGIVYPGLEMFFLALAPLLSLLFLFFTIDDGLGQKNKQASEAGRRRRLMAARLGELYGWTCGAGREAGMQGRLSFFIQMLPRGKFWLEVADEKLTSSIMRTRFVLVVSVY